MIGIAGSSIDGIVIGALVSAAEILGIMIFIGISELRRKRAKKIQSEHKGHDAVYSRV